MSDTQICHMLKIDVCCIGLFSALPHKVVGKVQLEIFHLCPSEFQKDQ